MAEQHPLVGVGVLVFRNGKILFGKRLKKDHGHGFYAGPGGHLEFGESIEECAAREVLEETGMTITNVRPIALINFLIDKERHYVDIGTAADWVSGEAKLLEPDKCAGWDWYALDALPKPLWDQIPLYLESLKTGKLYHGTVHERVRP